MTNETILFTLFMIFTGAAVLAALALYARQSLLVVYILGGLLFGPSGLKLVTDPVLIQEISHTGIIFLLFLLGIELPAGKLFHLVKTTTFVTTVSSLVFFLAGFIVAIMFGFGLVEGLICGAAAMFSSTIIGLKLLPTTVLHHRHQGEIIISILLLQDILAIVVLTVLQVADVDGFPWLELVLLFVALIGISIFAYLFHRYILVKIIARFDRIKEFIFIVTIGWCLGIAQLAASFKLSYEIGAFIAGVAFAANPIALFVSEMLKPLRDFFLVLFFFSLGANFHIDVAQAVLAPAALLALLLLIIKPLTFKFLLERTSENPQDSQEIGYRLGQVSEFSLLIAVLAVEMQIIELKAAYVIQVCTLLTFIVSSYAVVFKYPTPIAVSDRLRRD
ncbi:MAG: cation:proton antiporter [Gammaproteobacteria bacterium]|nr:cation:proton antiporter [Gammaproteobacteria bacterium]